MFYGVLGAGAIKSNNYSQSSFPTIIW